MNGQNLGRLTIAVPIKVLSNRSAWQIKANFIVFREDTTIIIKLCLSNNCKLEAKRAVRIYFGVFFFSSAKNNTNEPTNPSNYQHNQKTIERIYVHVMSRHLRKQQEIIRWTIIWVSYWPSNEIFDAWQSCLSQVPVAPCPAHLKADWHHAPFHRWSLFQYDEPSFGSIYAPNRSI